jgi:hypothetical protein
MVSSASSAFKCPRTTAGPTIASARLGALTDDALADMGVTLVKGMLAHHSAVFEKKLSLEAECFPPILVEMNQSRHKVCNAIEWLLVDMQQDQILAASSAALAVVPLQLEVGAD